MSKFVSTCVALIVVGVRALPHSTIRVVADREPFHVKNENLFLCPENATRNVDMSVWPEATVDIDGSECMNYQEMLIMDNQGGRLECIAHVTNYTTHVLNELGLPAVLTDGTLLGWSRHDQGVIPWDVDGDVGIVNRQCRKQFEKFGGKHKNLVGLLDERTDKGYYVGARLTGVGSMLDPDSFEGCETEELMVRGTYEGVTCHVDIWMLYHDDGSEDIPCSCPNDVPMPRLCRNVDYVCNQESEILPARWTTMTAGNVTANVLVPNKPNALAEQIYPTTSLTNMRNVPGNYYYGDNWVVVVGEGLSSAFVPTPKTTPAHTKLRKSITTAILFLTSDGSTAHLRVYGFAVAGVIVGALCFVVYMRRRGRTIVSYSHTPSE